MMLPRVLDQQNVKQQVGVMTHVVPVCKATVPEKFCEKCLRELRVFPTAILQQLEAFFSDIRVFNQLLDITKEKKFVIERFRRNFYSSNLVRLNSNSSASGDSGKSWS